MQSQNSLKFDIGQQGCPFQQHPDIQKCHKIRPVIVFQFNEHEYIKQLRNIIRSSWVK